MNSAEYVAELSKTERGREALLVQANAGRLMYSTDEVERQKFRDWAKQIFEKWAREDRAT